MKVDYKLDPHSPMPLYYQVYNSVMDRIATTEFKPNELLPSERLLTDQYDVSRITISKAMDLLKEQGLIRFHHGKGHYVNRQKIHTDPMSRASITDHMRQQGVDIQWQVLSRTWLRGPDSASTGLGLPANRRFHLSKLLLLSANKPVGFHYLYVPAKIARASKIDDMLDETLLDFLRDSPTASNCQLQRSLDAMLADGEPAEVLSLEKGAALMRIDILYKSHQGKLVQAMRSFYCGESFSYKF